MKQRLLLACWIASVTAAAACARPTIIVGNHLPPISGLFTIDILVQPGPPGESSGEPTGGPDGNEQTAAGVELFLLVGNGIAGPAITSIDFTTGTVWGANQLGNLSLGLDPPGREVAMSTATLSGEMLMSGVLAHVTFDMTGVPGGVYSVALINSEGTTDFGISPGFDAVLVNGSIFVPEPGSFVPAIVGAFGLALMQLRRRRR